MKQYYVFLIALRVNKLYFGSGPNIYTKKHFFTYVFL